MAHSIISTQPPKGQVYPTTNFSKGEVEGLKFSKGPLAAEYGLEKPNYSLHETRGPPHDRKFFVKCRVEDVNNGNLFIQISNGEKTIKAAEHEAARKILHEMKEVYYFSEEHNLDNQSNETYVICLDNPSKILLKLYKWENCCEYCYIRGHTMSQCNKRVKRNKHLKEVDQMPQEEDFWGPIDEPFENANLIHLAP